MLPFFLTSNLKSDFAHGTTDQKAEKKMNKKVLQS
jgi:hypothetical protein